MKVMAVLRVRKKLKDCTARWSVTIDSNNAHCVVTAEKCLSNISELYFFKSTNNMPKLIVSGADSVH